MTGGHTTSERLRLRVARKSVAAEDIASFELVDPTGRDLPVFAAGAHIDVCMAEDLVRQYSLLNDPRERHRYCLGVLREPVSTGGSVHMHDEVTQGGLLEASAPRNSFHLVEDAAHSILLAGGIGVTPILTMAHRLWALGNSFEMHYCTRSRARTAFYDDLQAAGFSDRVRFHFDDGPASQLLDIPKRLARYDEAHHLYVCGPPGFMDAVITASEDSWPAGTVHREYFSNDPQAGHDDDESFHVTIDSTGETVEIPAGRTIVEMLTEVGIDVSVSCEQGICGTCLTGVLKGDPDHRDLVLTDEERAANDQMTLCCSRAKSPVLLLDL